MIKVNASMRGISASDNIALSPISVNRTPACLPMPSVQQFHQKEKQVEIVLGRIRETPRAGCAVVAAWNSPPNDREALQIRIIGRKNQTRAMSFNTWSPSVNRSREKDQPVMLVATMDNTAMECETSNAGSGAANGVKDTVSPLVNPSSRSILRAGESSVQRALLERASSAMSQRHKYYAELSRWESQAPAERRESYSTIADQLKRIHDDPDALDALDLTIANTQITCLPTIPPGVKRLNLSGCTNLLVAPPFAPGSALRYADFSGCSKLVTPPDFSYLFMLLSADLTGCSSLVAAPKLKGCTALKLLILAGCDRIQDRPDYSDCPRMQSILNWIPNPWAPEAIAGAVAAPAPDPDTAGDWSTEDNASITPEDSSSERAQRNPSPQASATTRNVRGGSALELNRGAPAGNRRRPSL